MDKYWIKLWNYWHCKICQQGASVRNFKMANLCEKILLKAKRGYYAGDNVMSDKRFDMFEQYLRILRSDSNVLNKVG